MQLDTNEAVTKLSPFKPLTEEQKQLVDRVYQFSLNHLQTKTPAIFTIIGDAGTGKSVVLSHLFKTIQDAARTDKSSKLYHTSNHFIVNHPEVLKVYKQIAGTLPNLLKKDYLRPTTFINQLDKHVNTSDIAIIDEAHLLLSQPDHYNNFYHKNQLQEIINHSKVVIIVFDEHQVLKMKSLWTKTRLFNLLGAYTHEEYYLTHQFRMTASQQLLQWFDTFTDQQRLTDIPINANDHYDFEIFDDAEKMRQKIVQRNQEVGLSRIL